MSEEIVFKKLTRQSIKDIDNLVKQKRENKKLEKASLTDVEEKTSRCACKRKKKPDKTEDDEVVVKKIPKKAFAAETQLSQRYQHLFHKTLIGVPLEEVDEFYKEDYVNISDAYCQSTKMD